MSLIYPSVFPCPSRIEGHSQASGAGLVRTDMSAGNTRQRRTHRNLPTLINLVFMVHQPELAAWVSWVNTNAWRDAITIKLPGLEASRLGVDTTSIVVRFMSDLQMDLLPVKRLWYWRVRVAAEYYPTPEQLAVLP